MPRKKSGFSKQPAIERMESRILLAATPPGGAIAGDVLTVTGTAGADVISVQSIFDDQDGDNAPINTYVVTVNGATQTLTSTAVTSLVINSGQGNDSINVSSVESSGFGVLAIKINAGDGNDTIDASLDETDESNSTVVAGNGNDEIYINNGASASISAGSGNDNLEIDNDDVASITAGNGNDFFEAGGEVSDTDLTVTAGSGDDTFYNEDSDNPPLTATAAGGPAFTVTYESTSATGRAYIDNNNDGIFDAGDTPLADAQVYFDANNDGVFDAGDTAAVSNAQGYYSLSDLNPGQFDSNSPPIIPLRVTPPAGYMSKTFLPPLAVAFGSSGVDLGVTRQKSLTGTLIATPGSYQNDGNTAAKAVDGSLSTFFDAPTANGNYVGLNLGATQTIAAIAYAPRPGFASRMVGGIFQGSNSSSFSSPVTLYTITATPPTGLLTTVAVPSSPAVQYVRYLAPNGSYGNAAEVQFFKSPSVGTALTIAGTAGADNIAVTVAIDSSTNATGTATITGTYTVDINGATTTYNASGINGLVINSGTGNDTISLSGSVDVTTAGYPSPFFQITAGGGNDSISSLLTTNEENGLTPFVSVTAGDGDDTLNVGGGPLQHITVGNGNDVINLSGGNDGTSTTLVAGNGNDIVTESNGFQNAQVTIGTGINELFASRIGDSLALSLGDGSTYFLTNSGRTVIGRAYVDTNHDGIYEPGEPVLAGSTVFVDSNGDGVFDAGDASAKTDANGIYWLSLDGNNDSSNDTFSLSVVPPSGDTAVPGSVALPNGSISYAAESIDGLNLAVLPPKRFAGTPIGTPGSYGNSGNTIAKAFDGNLVSYFDAPTATGNWVGLDLGTAQVVTQVKYSPRPSFESRTIGGQIQGSNTADFSSGVTTLATITAYPTPGVLNTLSFTNTTAFRYYRYIGPANSYCDIAELQFYS